MAVEEEEEEEEEELQQQDGTEVGVDEVVGNLVDPDLPEPQPQAPVDFENELLAEAENEIAATVRP